MAFLLHLPQTAPLLQLNWEWLNWLRDAPGNLLSNYSEQNRELEGRELNRLWFQVLLVPRCVHWSEYSSSSSPPPLLVLMSDDLSTWRKTITHRGSITSNLWLYLKQLLLKKLQLCFGTVLLTTRIYCCEFEVGRIRSLLVTDDDEGENLESRNGTICQLWR